jgi:hypothetical protein
MWARWSWSPKAIENLSLLPQYLPGAEGQEEAETLDRDVARAHVVETIIDLDRKELLSILRDVQDVDVSEEEELVVEPEVIWLG